jgi:hypothetical protein
MTWRLSIVSVAAIALLVSLPMTRAVSTTTRLSLTTPPCGAGSKYVWPVQAKFLYSVCTEAPHTGFVYIAAQDVESTYAQAFLFDGSRTLGSILDTPGLEYSQYSRAGVLRIAMAVELYILICIWFIGISSL